MPLVTSLHFLEYRENAEKLCRKKVAAAQNIVRAVYKVSQNLSITQKDVENALQRIAQERKFKLTAPQIKGWKSEWRGVSETSSEMLRNSSVKMEERAQHGSE
jgi:hypothetical protein